MNVTLGKVTKDKRHFNKSVSSQVVKSCTMIEPFNLREPTIIINYDESILNYNYALITLGGKTYHYYIMNKAINKHNITLNLHLDPLPTYASEIKSSVCHITRSNIGNKLIVDPMAKRLEGNNNVFRVMGTGLSSGVTFVMIKGK